MTNFEALLEAGKRWGSGAMTGFDSHSKDQTYKVGRLEGHGKSGFFRVLGYGRTWEEAFAMTTPERN